MPGQKAIFNLVDPSGKVFSRLELSLHVYSNSIPEQENKNGKVRRKNEHVM